MSNETKDNFPYFLYEKYPEVLEIAKRFNFTAEEIEIYCYYFYMREQGKKITDYTFFDKHGGFTRTWSILQKMKNLLNVDHLRDEEDIYPPDQWIYDYGIRNPGKPYNFFEENPRKLYLGIIHLFNAQDYENEFSTDCLKYLTKYKDKHWEINYIFSQILKSENFPIAITDYEERTVETYSEEKEIEFIENVVKLSHRKQKYQLRDFVEIKECFYLEERDVDEVYLCLTPIGEKFIEWLNEK